MLEHSRTEVTEMDNVCTIVKKAILKFKITMNNSIPMAEADGRHDLSRGGQGPGVRMELGSLFYSRLTAATQLSHLIEES